MTASGGWRTIAIVGGGFSGAAVAYHLAKSGVEARVVVFEPRARLGAGLAYSDDDPARRINVPAARMSLLPDDPTHFARWLAGSRELANDSAAISGGEAFPARAVFGRYVEEALRPLVREGRIVHVEDKVVSLQRHEGFWRLETARGERCDADLAVIATTHPSPGLPRELEALRDDPRLVADALAPRALDRVEAANRVLIVGTGLTAADIVASLDATGHRALITMISRRGLRSRGAAKETFPPEGDFVSVPARAASEILHKVRRAAREATGAGRSWHPVLDAVREQGQEIWRGLSPDARRRIARRLRPYWDAHRFRAAPQIEALLDRRIANGSLELLKARLGAVRLDGSSVSVELVDARGRVVAKRSFDRIVVATGPAHGDVLDTQTYLEPLARSGSIVLDPVGLGLWTSRNGRALAVSGRADPSLFVAGPLARGTFGELMGLPQVSAYARVIAEEVAAELARTPAHAFDAA